MKLRDESKFIPQLAIGIQDIFGNYKKTVAIEIDDYEISIDDLVIEYNNQISTISSQLNKQITLKESLDLGIDEIALENLIRKLVLQIEINKLKLGISDDFIAERSFNGDRGKLVASILRLSVPA